MANAEERRASILSKLREQNAVRVSRLAMGLGVSSATIRADLRALNLEGKLMRQHGGARVLHSAAEARRLSIPKLAATLVAPGEKIILGAGGATLQMARLLRDGGPLTVFSNCLSIANELLRMPHIETIVAGGTVRADSQLMLGPHAESALGHYQFDKLFLCAEGLTPDFGLSSDNEAVARINARMMQRARQVIVLADSAQVGRCCLYQIADLGGVTAIVSDAGLSADMRTRLEAHGLQTYIAT